MTRLLLCLSLFLTSCGHAGASSVVAQEVSPPSPDVRCFAILEDGHAVGGGCVLR